MRRFVPLLLAVALLGACASTATPTRTPGPMPEPAIPTRVPTTTPSVGPLPTASVAPLTVPTVPAFVPTPFPTPTATPTIATGAATTTPLVIPDCGYSGRASAWLDQNADGVRDPDEPPIAGIVFVLLLGGGNGRYVTDAAGEANIYTLTSCTGPRAELIAEIPIGYRATTPARRAAAMGNVTLALGLVATQNTP